MGSPRTGLEIGESRSVLVVLESFRSDHSNDIEAHLWHPGTGKVNFGSRTKRGAAPPPPNMHSGVGLGVLNDEGKWIDVGTQAMRQGNANYQESMRQQFTCAVCGNKFTLASNTTVACGGTQKHEAAAGVVWDCLGAVCCCFFDTPGKAHKEPWEDKVKGKWVATRDGPIWVEPPPNKVVRQVSSV